MDYSGLINKINRGWMLTVLIFCLTTTAFAQLPQEKREAPPMEQLPQEQRQITVTYEDEIKVKELPDKILKSLEETYPDYQISESYRGSDGSCKVVVERGDEKMAVYYNPEGEFKRIEEEKEEETINDDWR